MHLHNASQHGWELHYRQKRLKGWKKKNHTFATGKILFLSILYSFQDCFTSQPGAAIIVDKTNFATGHGLSMFYFVPYSKHIASKIQSSHRLDFILCLRTWMYGGIGQKACVVTTETVRNKMEEAKQVLCSWESK